MTPPPPPRGISWSKLVASGTFDCSRTLTTPQGTRSDTRSRTHLVLGSFNKIDGLTLHVALDEETGCIAFDLAGRFFAIMGSGGKMNFIDNYLASAQLAVDLGGGHFLTAIPYSQFLPVLRCVE